MTSKEWHFAGYWNGDIDNWRITECPVEDEENILVTVCIEEVQTREAADKYNHKKIKRSMKKISRELRDFVVSSKKWE
jgi:hypothetical protein